VIAATTENVGHPIEAGAFRRDLFYRLNQVSLMLPPLRDRQEDIPSLVTHFLRQFAVTHFKKVERVTPEAMERLLVYDYPGNVRELRSAIERAVLLAEGPDIMPSHLPPSIQAAGGAEVRPLFSTLEEQERHYIAKVLQVTRGHRGEAARILGIDRRTLYDKIRRYGLVVTHGTGTPRQHAPGPTARRPRGTPQLIQGVSSSANPDPKLC
jgi:DNA-binding NtrC family response regulator